MERRGKSKREPVLEEIRMLSGRKLPGVKLDNGILVAFPEGSTEDVLKGDYERRTLAALGRKKGFNLVSKAANSGRQLEFPIGWRKKAYGYVTKDDEGTIRFVLRYEPEESVTTFFLE
ncbi:hypothetical protein IID22_01330 [Patescibacteria group bacterium]|nr:hypothetical protein [Patescibacteria group bacterium]